MNRQMLILALVVPLVTIGLVVPNLDSYSHKAAQVSVIEGNRPSATRVI